MSGIGLLGSVHTEAEYREYSRQQEVEKKGRQWTLFTGGFALCSSIGLIAIQVFDTFGWASTPKGNALLPYLTGAALWHSFQAIPPRFYSNQLNDVLADYSTPVFLITTEVFKNLSDPSSMVKRVLFNTLSGMAGASVASFCHIFITRHPHEKREGESSVLLKEKSVNGEGSKDLFNYTLRVPLLGKAGSRALWNGAKSAFGVALAVAAYVRPQFALLGDFGLMLVGDGSSQLLMELFYHKAFRVLEKSGSALLGLGSFLPGAMLALAASTAETGYRNTSIFTYFLTGAFLGGRRAIERLRFLTTNRPDLKELDHEENQLKSTSLKVCRVAKWSFALLGMGGFLAFGVAGWSFQSMDFQSTPLVDQASLIAFGVGAYLSYAVSSLAKRNFRGGFQSRPIWNSLYFDMLYSPGIPWTFAYVIGRMNLGNQFLNGASTLAGAVATLAYFSFGWGVGTEAGSRGNMASPRVVSSLGALLLHTFVAQQYLGEA